MAEKEIRIADPVVSDPDLAPAAPRKRPTSAVLSGAHVEILKKAAADLFGKVLDAEAEKLKGQPVSLYDTVRLRVPGVEVTWWAEELAAQAPQPAEDNPQ